MARIRATLVTAGILGAALSSCMSTARVSDVYMALDENGDRPRSVFYTDTKEIHCIVEVGIGRSGVTLETIVRQFEAYDFTTGKWQKVDRITANVETSPQPQNGVQRTGITVKPQGLDGSDGDGAPYQAGHFQCEAYLDGTLEKTAIFNVDFPSCPTSSIRPATTCLGFYKLDTQCKKFGATAGDTAQCRCSAKGWECDP